MVEVAGLNPCSLFRAETGLPPYPHVTQFPVQEAARRLARGEDIATVALDTGFADPLHRTRRFKRLDGAPHGPCRPS